MGAALPLPRRWEDGHLRLLPEQQPWLDVDAVASAFLRRASREVVVVVPLRPRRLGDRREPDAVVMQLRALMGHLVEERLQFVHDGLALARQLEDPLQLLCDAFGHGGSEVLE